MFSRLRQNNQLEAGKAKVLSNGTWSETSTGYKNLGVSQVVYDNKTPHFTPGHLRISPVDMRKFVGLSTPSDWYWKSTVYGWNDSAWTGDVASLNANPPSSLTVGVSIDPILKDLAYTKALARCSEPDLDLGMVIAEYSETMAMLKRPLKPLVRKMGELSNSVSRKRKSSKRRGNLEDAMADGWLVARYGVIPLISDVSKIIQRLSEIRIHYESTLERRKGSVYSAKTVESVQIEGYSSHRARWKIEVTETDATYCGLYFKNLITHAESFGISVFDLPAMAWERIPYSFVVDWAFNFGDWLRAMQPEPAIEMLSGYITRKKETIYRRFPMHVWINGLPESYAYEVRSAGMYLGTTTFLRREVIAPYPVMPGINAEIMNLTRAIDSVSLIWQNLPKLK